jgi:acetyl-CoA C-acetyltransferase
MPRKGRALASILSAGMSKFGARRGLGIRELFLEAFAEALERAPRLDPRMIQAAFVGTMSEGFEGQGNQGAEVVTWTGLQPHPGIRVEAACASSGAALRYGLSTILAGIHDVVLIGGVEKMTNVPTAEATELIAQAADAQMDQRNGLTFPGFFGLLEVLHMKKYGSTLEDFAAVSVKNHKNGVLNPKAHFQRMVSLDQTLNSKIVSWPIRLYDCAPISDGAACMILAKPEIARRLTDLRVDVIGQGLASDNYLAAEKDYSTITLNANVHAATEAYRMAGVKPAEIDLAEVHDCFSCAEIIAYEDLGFCDKGKGQNLIRDGETERDGAIPVNVSGGLKSKGHPVGATGSAQLYEMFLQLNGLAGSRQVDGVELGLTQNLGGCGATASVTICAKA